MDIQKNTIIPEKCRVGFQRNINVNNKKIHLAFITYYLDGKLRKEKSFNSWINKKIDPIDIENKPIVGFKILETPGVRYITDAKYVRILDPRGFIFEINISNLLSIINDTDIINSVIRSKCVFAYNRGNLILIPVKSKYYDEIRNYTTARINNKFTKKDMIIGHTYLAKDGMEYVFIGNYNVLTVSLQYKKSNIYFNVKNEQIILKSGYASFIKDLGEYNTFDKLLHSFNNTLYVRKIKDFKLIKKNYEVEIAMNNHTFFTKDLMKVIMNFNRNIFGFNNKKLYVLNQVIIKNDKYGNKFISYEKTSKQYLNTTEIYSLILIFDNGDEYNYNEINQFFIIK